MRAPKLKTKKINFPTPGTNRYLCPTSSPTSTRGWRLSILSSPTKRGHRRLWRSRRRMRRDLSGDDTSSSLRLMRLRRSDRIGRGCTSLKRMKRRRMSDLISGGCTSLKRMRRKRMSDLIGGGCPSLRRMRRRRMSDLIGGGCTSLKRMKRRRRSGLIGGGCTSLRRMSDHIDGGYIRLKTILRTMTMNRIPSRSPFFFVSLNFDKDSITAKDLPCLCIGLTF